MVILKKTKMIQFYWPFTLICSGASCSGKTFFTIELINNLNSIVSVNVAKIIWCYAESCSLTSIQNRIVKEQMQKIQFVKGIPNEFENEENEPILVVLDDLMMEANSARICELFTKGSHHRNMSVILITQNLFHQGKYCRDISLNTKYFVIFKNVRDQSQFMHLCKQCYTENSKDLLKIYKEITNKPHSYILLDLTQDIHRLLRFRTDIFNKEHTTIYCAPDSEPDLQHETLAGQQAHVICSSEC